MYILGWFNILSPMGYIVSNSTMIVYDQEVYRRMLEPILRYYYKTA